mgnify:CR=1 FL=1
MPALIERVRPPLGLRGLQATDLIDWDGSDDAAAIRQLISDITAMMQAHGTPRTQPEPISAGVTASLSPVLALLACTPVQPPGATAPAPSAISTAVVKRSSGTFSRARRITFSNCGGTFATS